MSFSEITSLKKRVDDPGGIIAQVILWRGDLETLTSRDIHSKKKWSAIHDIYWGNKYLIKIIYIK